MNYKIWLSLKAKVLFNVEYKDVSFVAKTLNASDSVSNIVL